MKISCIIIDDDPDALKLLEEFVRAVPFLDLKAQFYDPFGAYKFLRGTKVDVIIADVAMTAISGLQFARLMPHGQKFVFTTSNAKHALNSFQFHVIDYLVKPVSFTRFLVTAEKIKMMHTHELAGGSQGMHMFARTGGQVVRINFDDILYIRGEKEYVGIHFKDKRILIYKRMKEMESLLPGNFKRVHLSFIVNVNHVDKVAANQIFTGDEKIPIALSYRHTFHEYINERLFKAQA